MRKVQTQSSGLVHSLLAFQNSAEHQELFEYLSEHLYIQSHMTLPRFQQFGTVKGMDNFHQSCKKLYYASDEGMRNQALDELRVQMAV